MKNLNKMSKKILKLLYGNRRYIPVYMLAAYCFFVFTVYLRQEQLSNTRLFTALGFLFIFTALLSVCMLVTDGMLLRKMQFYGMKKWIKRHSIWINGSFLLLSPFASFIMVETMVGNYNPDMFKAYGLYNLIWYIGIYFLIFALFMNIRLTIKTGSIIIYFASMVNYLVYTFRGNPILPSDILVWRTGLSVAGSYQLSFTKEFLAATLIMVALFTAAHMIDDKSKKPLLMHRLIAAGSFAVYIMLVFYWFFHTDLVKSKIRVIDFFAPKYTYCSYGTAFGFAANIEAMEVKKPEGYSKKKAEKILASAKDMDEEKKTTAEEKPDLIVIMNEAFSDLSLVGDYTTNMDYLPNIRSLNENTIKGVLYVSVFGGATSDTEYEFLTGNSMAVMPPNCVPYQQFVTEPTASLASTLRAQGYYNIAIHPYKPTGYKRDLVYPLLGFDEFISEDDFINPYTIRGYISDRESYSKIIEEYETKKDKGPLLFFNVTMQNHGGYSSDQIFSDEETVILQDYPGFGYVDQYLSLLRESDKAFSELTDYFKKQDRPVIILLFGDHQPIAYSGLYDIMPDRKKAEQLKYRVPFVIWANYDIKEDYVDAISANYLSSYLLNVAGLDETVYSKYLMKLYGEIPVINALFYMDKDNNLYSLSADSCYKELINDYKCIGYNNAFDKRNKLKEYYYLNQDRK